MKQIVIVGAGCIGCAAALYLKRAFPVFSVTVLERHEAEFMEMSRYNSGVIHSGLHQCPDSLKFEFAVRGSKLLVEFAEHAGVRITKSGMLIVASGRDLVGLTREIGSLFRMRRNATQKRIPLKVLSGRALRRIEPEVRALLGVHLPDIWVVDQVGLGKKIREYAAREGVEFFFGAKVERIVRKPQRYEFSCAPPYHEPAFPAHLVVNAAGISADLLAREAHVRYRNVYLYRGEYYEVVTEKRNLIEKTLIYPALPPGHPVKGVHLTKTVDGRLLIGPNSKRWDGRADDFTVRSGPREFLDGARRFLPELSLGDVAWSYSGIRPKLNQSTHEEDFSIASVAGDPYFVNLLGIESPGLTASFTIAEHLVSLVGMIFQRKPVTQQAVA